MKKLAAALMAATATAVVPVAIAPGAHATICAGTDGSRHVSVSGCTDVAGRAAGAAAIASSTDPYWPGEQPCYTAEGVPYFTPDGDPC